MSITQNRRRRWRAALGAMALAAALVGAGQDAGAATAGTTKGANIVNMVKVEYLDANGKGVNGGTSPIAKSASVSVTVSLLSATPSIGNPTPTPVQTVESGAVQTYAFKVWSNANGKDNYMFSVAGTGDTTTTSADRYIASYTDALGNVTSTAGSGVTNVSFDIGAVTIVSNTASTVTIPYNTKVLNQILDGDLVVINNTEYRVKDVANPGSAAVYDASGNTLTNEIPMVLNLTLPDGSTSPNFTVNALTGLTLSEEYLVTVAVTATGDPNQTKGTSCFSDTLASTTDPSKSISANPAPSGFCTDFKSSNLSILKAADNLTPKPTEKITYTVTVSLPSTAAKSTKVKVADAVPVYTTLVSDTYGAGTFARVRKSVDGGANYGSWVNLSNANSDSEDTALASGDAAGSAANAALTFYLGAGNVGTGSPAGGVVNPNETFQIEYKVTVN